MNGAVSSFTSRRENRVVGYRGSQTSSGSLSEGVGGTTTDNEGTSDGSDNDTSNNTSGDSSDGSDGESTNSGALDVTSFVVRYITSGDGTVVRGGADDVEDEASALVVTVRFVTDIGPVTSDIGVDADGFDGRGVGVTHVDGAGVVILAVVIGEGLVDAANGDVTVIRSAHVSVVAGGVLDGGPHALVVEGVGCVQLTKVLGTQVTVAAVLPDQTRRLGRAQVGVLDEASVRVADVPGAVGAGGDGLVPALAPGDGVAPVGLAQVGAVAVSPLGVLAVGDVDLHGVHAHVDGTLVAVAAVLSVVTLGVDGAEVGVLDEAGVGVAAEASAGGVCGDGLHDVGTSGSGVARVGVALVATRAVLGFDLTVGRVRVSRVGDDACFDGAGIGVGAVTIDEALGRAQVGVDGLSGGRVALVVGARSVGLDGLGGGSTSSLASVRVTVASVGHALVGIVARAGRLGYGVTASSGPGDGVAEVSFITTIGGYASFASAETTARGASGVFRALLASHQHQVIDEGRELIPVGGSEYVGLDTIGDGQKLFPVPDITDTDGKDGNGGYLALGVVHGPREIVDEASTASSLGPVFATGRTAG